MVLTENYDGVSSFVRHREATDEMMRALVDAGFRLEHYIEGCSAFRQILPGAWFGPAWEAYSVELVGLQYPPEVTPVGPIESRYTFVLSNGEIELQVWRRIVRTSLSAAFVDARRNPATGLLISICGVEAITRLSDLDPARRGIRLLKEVDKRGKKPMTSRDHPTADALLSELHLAFEDLRRENTRPTAELIARKLKHPKSARRMQELIREYGLRERWDEMMRMR